MKGIYISNNFTHCSSYNLCKNWSHDLTVSWYKLNDPNNQDCV